MINYVQELERVEECLQDFYAGPGNRYKRHKWDLQKAREYEYRLIADRLLGIVGGSLGKRYDPSNPVLIGVGLGKFSNKSGLSALNSIFLNYFIQTITIGYLKTVATAVMTDKTITVAVIDKRYRDLIDQELRSDSASTSMVVTTKVM